MTTTNNLSIRFTDPARLGNLGVTKNFSAEVGKLTHHGFSPGAQAVVVETSRGPRFPMLGGAFAKRMGADVGHGGTALDQLLAGVQKLDLSGMLIEGAGGISPGVGQFDIVLHCVINGGLEFRGMHGSLESASPAVREALDAVRTLASKLPRI